MPAFLQPVWRAIVRANKAFQDFVIRIVLQKIIGTTVLYLVYFFGVGCTALFCRIFARNSLNPPYAGKDTYWVKASGYDPDPVKSTKQS